MAKPTHPQRRMTPRPAQYLLRFDDLCPTMHMERWRRYKGLIEEFGLRPILAVVPENRDPNLIAAPENPAFWEEMRALEAAGAGIALHGFQHLCRNRGRSLVPLHRHSEFAGVGEKTQRLWIRHGLDILREQGLHPSIWVAPRHGFDRNTLRALRAEGIGILSDGQTRVPFLRGGLVWIPQQLWAPRHKSSGVWTICLHTNTASPAAFDKLRAFVAENASRFTSVDDLLKTPPRRLGLVERLREFVQWARMWSGSGWKHYRRRQQRKRSHRGGR